MLINTFVKIAINALCLVAGGYPKSLFLIWWFMSVHSSKQVVEMEGGRRIEIRFAAVELAKAVPKGQVYVFNPDGQVCSGEMSLTPPLSVEDAIKKYGQMRPVISSTNHPISE